MNEKKINWTDQQRRAIAARGNDVLVAASAGTGKTAVLSGRCVSLVSDQGICPDVLNVLVLTFTEAAAEQMRSRIAEHLTNLFRESRDPRIGHQLLLLQAADISTIHSFCRRLITEYFYKDTFGLDPVFSVIDADESMLLKAEVLERTIDWAWKQSNLVPGLVELLRRRDLRSGDGFLARIIELSEFLDSLVSRSNWCDRACQLAQAANPLATSLGEEQKRIIADKLQSMLAQTEYYLRLCTDQHVGGDFVAKWQEGFVKPITRYLELLRSGDWDAFAVAVRSYQPPSKIEYKRAGLSDTTAEIMKGVAKKTKSFLSGLLDTAILNPEYLNVVGAGVSRQTRILIELVKKFDMLYAQAKRSLNCLDFADLEHHALRLLTIEDSQSGALSPSGTALTLRDRYKFIFVDEYQDINPVQQAILDSLSSGNNVFVVGDVKQSIYAWRGAEPSIFLHRLKPASVAPAQTGRPLRIDLNTNFRSSKGILDFANRIFSRIMTSSFAGIDYDDSAALRPAPADGLGNRLTEDKQPTVEFHILDETAQDRDSESQEPEQDSADEQSGLVSARQRQAALIAERIKQLVGADTGKAELRIFDKEQGGLRDVQYRDIVVLMRSLAKKANDYVEILRLAGIPVSCDATAGYFQTTEITDVLCLLKVLDNPQRDIELAAALRSPFFNVTDTELAKIRIHSGQNNQPGNCYTCVVQYSHTGPGEELRNKLKRILDQIDEWRKMARRGNIADLLWHIYRKTGFLSFVSALPNGQSRRANLLKLHDRAIQFAGFAGSAGAPSLSRFIQFIEKLQEVGQDWAPAQPAGAAGNSVRILSVHKSKGLEFPVVFLAELESRFNKKDIQADVIVDADNTLGLRIIDRASNSRLNSLAYEVIADKKLSTSLAEEMRILYVATTRAKHKLILTASQKRDRCRQIIANGSLLAAGPIPRWRLRDCQSPLEWIVCALADQKALHDAFQTQVDDSLRDDGLFDFRLYGQTELTHLSDFVRDLRSDKRRRTIHLITKRHQNPKQPQLLSRIKESLAWSYPLADISFLPAKTSVTELTHRSDEYVKFDCSAALDRQPSALAASQPSLPQPRPARLIGVATHLVFSKLDLAEPVTQQSVDDIKCGLVVAGTVTSAVADHIDGDSVGDFFQTEPGRLVFDAGNTVWREWPFTFALPASEFGGSSHEPRATGNEIIVVQGIIDLLVRTAEGLVVVDFKTDNILASRVCGRAEIYRRQLELYGRAASAILKEKLLAKWLYFLTPRRAVRL